jgi:citrate/tricarballylate utilization protein
VPLYDNAIPEGERLMTICNACRYCEGYCAVFPAMERRRQFTGADLDYLANLCHNCAECYYACQYAPPHEFAVNVPKALAEIRLQSYKKFTRPRPLAKLFDHQGLVAAVVIVLGLLLGTTRANRFVAGGNFYAVISHRAMLLGFGLASALVVSAWLAGFVRFWNESGEGFATLLRPRALARAINDVLHLKYLSNGGTGCTYPTEHHSQSRRWFHHLTFYGFMLCFASTCVAAIYDNFLGWKAPYPLLSLPVVLGTLGGAGLLIGPAGLAALKLRRNRIVTDPTQDSMDLTFIALLFASAATGLVLLALRDTPEMSGFLVLHLAVILALFAMLPYGKFVHGIYRTAALVRYAVERMRPQARR